MRPLLARYLGALHGQSILDDAGLGAARTQPFRDALHRAARVAGRARDRRDDGRAGHRRHRRRVPPRRSRAGPRPGSTRRWPWCRRRPSRRSRSSALGRDLSPAWKELPMPLRFGVHIPTCIEGMMYPVPFAKPEDILPTAQLAERVGFDSVWGNDHMTTQRYVQREWPEPPNFYEPLITFTWVAARTERIRLATGIIVLPMRTMPVLAKQVATLDQLSGGRVILGVGTGAYREEYEALSPDATRRPAGRDRRRGHARAAAALHRAQGDASAARTSASRTSSASPSRARRRCRCTRAATTRRCGAARASTARAGCRRCCRRRRSSEAWRTSSGRRPRPGATASRDRHRAAVRLLHRPHARRGGEALPRLAALQAPGVAQALHAARADGRLRAAQPDRQPGRDLRADPRLPAGGRHHAAPACSSWPTPCPRCRRRSTSSGARSSPTSR